MTKRTKAKPELKQWGGHRTGMIAKEGSGPVYELHAALDAQDKARGGKGWSAARLARAAGCSQYALRQWELNGQWPRLRRIQSNLRGVAAEHGIDVGPLPDEGGVIL